MAFLSILSPEKSEFSGFIITRYFDKNMELQSSKISGIHSYHAQKTQMKEILKKENIKNRENKI